MQRARECDAIAATHEVEIHHPRRFAQKVVVQRRLLDDANAQRGDHVVNLRLRQNQIAHHHRRGTHIDERRPRSESERRTDVNRANSDIEIRSRKAELVDAVGLQRSRFADRTIDVFPVRSVHRLRRGRASGKKQGQYHS